MTPASYHPGLVTKRGAMGERRLNVRKRLDMVVERIRALGGDVAAFHVEGVAGEREIVAIEHEIGRPLPHGLRRFFRTEAMGITLRWEIEPDRLPDDDVFAEGLAGGCDLRLSQLPTDWVNWMGWRDSFADPEAVGWPPEFNLEAYDAVFPLHSVMNGDQLIFADEPGEPSLVLYLDHEGGGFDRVQLASTLQDFLDTWTALGCPGPESWELERFYDYEAQRLSVAAGAGPAWLRLLAGARPGSRG